MISTQDQAIASTQHEALMQQVEHAALALAGRSREIEAQRWLPQDIADTLATAGLYRLLTPQAYGGHEAAPASFFKVIERLAQADAAAAWCCFISCTSSLLAAYLPEPEAVAIFSKPDLKAAGVFAPRGRAKACVRDGVPGLLVSGRWPWGSGTHNADIISAGCLLIDGKGQAELLADGTPRVVSVLLDRAQVELLDNWDSFGLCGTGSGEFEAKDAFVPSGRSASLFDGPRIDRPLYRFPVFGLLALSIAAVATGIANHALDSFIAQAGHTVAQASSKPLAAKATVQDAVARAEASLRSARAYLLSSIATAWQAAQQGGEMPLACRRDLRLASTHSVQTCAEVVRRVYTLAGGGAVFADSPLQRCLRDVQVATQHMMVNDASYELTGRLLLGLPTQVHTL